MSRAICDTDRVEVSWSGYRGARLAEVRCPVCRGPLRAARLSDSRPEVLNVTRDSVSIRYPWDWPVADVRAQVRNIPRSFFPPPAEWGAGPEAVP